ncbi:hypothetical protein AB4Y42_41835 [Paraburkholderia sp. EG286B]|uniref:hypothetical protein n=1 Tax=Paraburkholderia sp. EG286B TaxID=3237011 RepID=UPI0034D32F2C
MDNSTLAAENGVFHVCNGAAAWRCQWRDVLPTPVQFLVTVRVLLNCEFNFTFSVHCVLPGPDSVAFGFQTGEAYLKSLSHARIPGAADNVFLPGFLSFSNKEAARRE